jgi:polyhydroxybutyrate depolymerase
MKHVFLILLASVAPACLGQAQNIVFEHDGLTRQYRIHIPQGLDANAPLVMALHGYSGNNNEMMNNYGWTELADERGFVVAFPNGTRDPSNNRFWDVDYAFHQGLDIDDDGFLSSLAVHLQELHGLDPTRTFVSGFSNGAEMCFQLACRESETFVAFAPIIGMMMDTLFTNCNPAVLRSILSMNGTSDGVTLYEGDMGNSGGWGAYRSIPETMAFWESKLQLLQMERTFLPNADPDDGSSVRLDAYSSPLHQRVLNYYLINGGGHDCPGVSGNMDISATVEAWNFFDTITGGDGVGGCGPDTLTVGDNAVDTTARRGNTLDLAGLCDPGEFGSDASMNTTFYDFVAPEDGTYIVSTCNQAAWDTRLSVHAGDCAPENVIVCLDDSDGCDVYTTTLEFTASAGSLYVIALGGFAITDYGPATLTISGGDGGPPTGACCMAGSECSVMTALECGLLQSSTYFGDGSSCDDSDISCGGSGCLGDYNGDLVINGSDLATLLGFWNLPGADLDGDGNTNGADLSLLLGGWGPC